MNFQVYKYIPWVGPLSPNQDKSSAPTMPSAITMSETPKEKATVNENFWNWPLFSLIPWAIKIGDKIHFPTTVNKELKRHARPCNNLESEGQQTMRFRPYVSKVPWHTGPRGLLSQLFPRYGNYCGPNWSSGRDGGSPIWDKRPIDWLDFCCYCHDIGYDTHDQRELLKADLAFLECLEKPNMSTNGDPRIAHIYKFMCMSGLRNILIPYRQHLLKLQSANFFFPSVLLKFYSVRLSGWNFAKTKV